MGDLGQVWVTPSLGGCRRRDKPGQWTGAERLAGPPRRVPTPPVTRKRVPPPPLPSHPEQEVEELESRAGAEGRPQPLPREPG